MSKLWTTKVKAALFALLVAVLAAYGITLPTSETVVEEKPAIEKSVESIPNA